MEITRHDEQSKGRYEGRIEGREGVAELTYSRIGPKTLTADHTGVPVDWRGEGLGQALVERLVADARDDGVRIIAICPFIKAQLRRHPEWSDVMEAG